MNRINNTIMRTWRLWHVCQGCLKNLPSEKSGVAQMSMSVGLPHPRLKKQDVSSLPRLVFPGKTFIINSACEEQSFANVISKLVRSKVLGFDTETKPNFVASTKVPRPPALVQLACNDLCIIWRLQRCGSSRSETIPPLLADILTSSDILKVGHAATNDAIDLLKHYSVNTRNVLDTYHFATKLQLSVFSLQGLVAVLMGRRLCKSQKTSNWEKWVLTDSQVKYASADAWASLKIYQAMTCLAASKGCNPPLPMDSAMDLLKPKEKEACEVALRKIDADMQGDVELDERQDLLCKEDRYIIRQRRYLVEEKCKSAVQGAVPAAVQLSEGCQSVH